MASSRLSIFVRSYWDYYLELEDQFLKTKKYVAFDEYNKKTYSVEFLKLLQAVCSEIDVVAKEIASKIDADFVVDRNTTIQKWGFVLQNKMPQILNSQVIFNHNIRVCPWTNWEYEKFHDKKGSLRYRLKGKTKTPSWWTAYNAVKHRRTNVSKDGVINYTEANLYNLINSFAALYILENEYMCTLRGEQEPVNGIDESKLFQPYFENFDDVIY